MRSGQIKINQSRDNLVRGGNPPLANSAAFYLRAGQLLREHMLCIDIGTVDRNFSVDAVLSAITDSSLMLQFHRHRMCQHAEVIEFVFIQVLRLGGNQAQGADIVSGREFQWRTGVKANERWPDDQWIVRESRV